MTREKTLENCQKKGSSVFTLFCTLVYLENSTEIFQGFRRD